MEKTELSLQDLINKLINFLRLLKKRWWVILLTFLFFGSLGYIYAARKATMYEVNATLGVKGKYWSGVQSSALALASQFGFSLGSSGAFEPDNKTIIGITLSRQTIKSCLLEKQNEKEIGAPCLADEYSRIYKLYDKEGKAYQFKSKSIYAILPSEDSILEVIYDRVSKNNVLINLDEEIGMVKLKVNSLNPSFSKTLANSILKSINQFFIENQSDNQSKSYQIAKTRVDSIHTVLQMKEAQLARLTDMSMTSTTSSGHLSQLQLTRDVEILNKIYAEAIATLEINKVVLGRDKSVILTIDSPEFATRAVHISKKMYTLVFGFIGIFLAIFGIILINFYTKNVRPKLSQTSNN